MSANRVFVPQKALDHWLDKGEVALSGEELFIAAAGRHLRLTGALHFIADVTDSGDPHALLGKVKTLDSVRDMHGEHCADSVVLGDSAYQVIEGFLAEPLPPASASVAPSPARDGALEEADALAHLVRRLQAV
jgi:hypothetical protein